MLDCPNCKKPTISAWRKQSIGPLRKVRCPNRNAQISVGWLHSVVFGALTTLIPVVWLIVFIESGMIQAVAVVVLSLVAIGAYQHFLVPLKVRALSEDE